ncbi:MAG: hypothetical protein IJL15_01440 [Clostridia bacterium]|nr:hypothetical protein [Clostridia bacterium]
MDEKNGWQGKNPVDTSTIEKQLNEVLLQRRLKKDVGQPESSDWPPEDFDDPEESLKHLESMMGSRAREWEEAGFFPMENEAPAEQPEPERETVSQEEAPPAVSAEEAAELEEAFARFRKQLRRSEEEQPEKPVSPEPGKQSPRRGKARIDEVRTFVQTRFEDLEFDSFETAEEPNQPQKPFVVTLPDEVYRIGMPKEAPEQEAFLSEQGEGSAPEDQDVPEPCRPDRTAPEGRRVHKKKWGFGLRKQKGLSADLKEAEQETPEEEFGKKAEEQEHLPPERTPLEELEAERLEEQEHPSPALDFKELDAEELRVPVPLFKGSGEEEPKATEPAAEVVEDGGFKTIKLEFVEPEEENSMGKTVDFEEREAASSEEWESGAVEFISEEDEEQFSEAEETSGEETLEPEGLEEKAENPETIPAAEISEDLPENRPEERFEEPEEEAAPAMHPYDRLPGSEPVSLLRKRTKRARAAARLAWLPLLLQLLPPVFAHFPNLVPVQTLDHKWMALLAVGALALQLLLSAEVFRGAQEEWSRNRPASCTLVLLVCLLTLLQATVDSFRGGAILCLYPALLLQRALCNRRELLAKATADARLVRSSKKKWAPAFSKESNDGALRRMLTAPCDDGEFEGFFTKFFAPSSADRMATALLFGGVLLGAAFLWLNSRAPQPLPMATALLCAFFVAAPLPLFYAYDGPSIRLSKILRRRGVTVVGDQGAKELQDVHEILMNDEEFFAGRGPTVAGVKLYNKHTLEEGVLAAASIAHTLRLPLEQALLSMLDQRVDRLKNLTEVKYLEGGGLSAMVGGRVALLGNARFMQQNLIPTPRDNVAASIEKSGRIPLYLAFDSRLAAVYSLDYQMDAEQSNLLAKLTGAGVGIRLSTLDPLMTSETAEWIASLEPGSVQVITPRESRLLREETDRDIPPAAVSVSENPASMVWGLLGASQLRMASRINEAVASLAVAAGAALCGVLLRSGATSTLGLPGLLLFELVWLLPIWCVTWITTGIDKRK